MTKASLGTLTTAKKNVNPMWAKFILAMLPILEINGKFNAKI